MNIDEVALAAAIEAFHGQIDRTVDAVIVEDAVKAAIEAYEAECWQSIDEALRMQVDKKTLNVTDKRVAAIIDVNQYHIKQMNKFKARIDAAKKRLCDLKAKHTEWYRKHPLDCTEKDNVDLINNMESIAYSVDCYLDGVSGPYLEKEEV